MSRIRLLAWLHTGDSEFRLGERVAGGWRLSEPLGVHAIVDALEASAAGRPLAFFGSVVHGIIGAADITDYALALNVLLAERRRAGELALD